MIDRELEDAFDGLFIGDDPPRLVVEAVARLAPDVRSRLDDDSRRALAELVWMSNLLRDRAPMPPHGFAERVVEFAFKSSRPARSHDWRFAIVGTVVAAAVLFAIGLSRWRPAAQGSDDGGIVQGPNSSAGGRSNIAPLQPLVPMLGGSPGIALLDRFKKIVPTMPPEPSIERLEVATVISQRETGKLAETITAPAENLAAVGKSLEKEVKPIKDSVREAFAFLGEFPGREKRSL